MQKTRKTEPLPPVRVRREPPTLEEAVIAAQGLTDDLEQQIEVTAALMGLSEDEVRPQVVEAPRPTWPKPAQRQAAPPSKVVVIQRKSRAGVSGLTTQQNRRPMRSGL